jgi:hypothetical protein
MTVSDGDRFAIAMAKLSQARSAVYEATRIIEHLFESESDPLRVRGPHGLEPNSGSGISAYNSVEEEEDTECME